MYSSGDGISQVGCDVSHHFIRPEGPKERIAGWRKPPEKDSLLLLFVTL